MSFLRFSVPSEISGKTKDNFYDLGSSNFSSLRSYAGDNLVYVGSTSRRRRRVVVGNVRYAVLAWFGSSNGEDGKSPNGHSLISVLPISSCSRRGLRGEICSAVSSHFQNSVDEVETCTGRKGRTNPSNPRNWEDRKAIAFPGIATSKRRSKYVRKDTSDLEAIVSSIRPNTSVDHCNGVLKLLERRSAEKAIAFFDWMKSNRKLNQNTEAYRLVLRALSSKDDWNSAEKLLEEMVYVSNCELNIQLFNSLIYACVKTGLPKQGAKWFQVMLEKGIQPNFTVIGMVMSLYQKTGSLPEAEYTFRQMRRFKLRHVPAYSTLITLYTRLGLYRKSEEIINLMKEDNVTPNLENWLVQLNAYCQQGKLEEAELVFRLMQNSGFSANIDAYNTLITGYGKAANTKAVQDLYQSLQVVGIKPDETTYRSMIEGYGRTDDYAHSKLYYRKLKRSGFHPSSSNFYTMINLLARHGDDNGVIQIFKDMRAVGCEYSSILSIVLHAYERIGRMDKVSYMLKGELYENILLDQTSCSILVLAYVRNSLLGEALSFLRSARWKDSSFQTNLYHTLICSCKEASNYEGAVMIFNQMPKSEANPNLHITCSLIDIYSCMNRFHDAEDLYLKLKASGVALDMIAYSIIVRMYVKSGSLKDACLVLDMMDKQKDITPDTYLYRDMLRIYQKCGNSEKLADVYYKMLKSSLVWDEAMYNCVINCCGHALPIDEISKLFDDMMLHGFAASNFTFNVMLDVFGKSGLLRRARKLFYMACKQGLADVVSYNTMIAAYGKMKDTRMMRHVIQQMQNAGHSVSLEAYNCLLDAYGKEDQLEEFNDTLQVMKKSQCLSDHYTYNIMINIYGKKGWIEDVACVLAELRKHGLEPDLYSYNTLIKAYGVAGMVEEAVNVVKEIREKGLHPDRITFVNLIIALQRNEKYLEAVKWSLWMKQMDLSLV